MKNILLLTVLFVLVHSFAITAQEKRETFKTKISLPPIEKTLDKKKKYKVVFSDNIKYMLTDESSYMGGMYAKFNFNFDIGPKQAKDNENADYIIEIVAGEIRGRSDMCDRNVNLDAIEHHVNVIRGGSKPVEMHGYIIDFCVSFPLLANIKENGEIIKTIILSDNDKLYTIMYHAALCDETPYWAEHNNFEFVGHIPFATKKEIENTLETDNEIIMKRIQKNIIGRQIQELKYALELCYNEKGWNEKVEIPYMLISKKKNENYESFFNQAKLIKETIGEVLDTSNLTALPAKLQPIISYYKDNSENDNKIIAMFNLIHCYAFAGNIKDAAEHYKLSYFIINESRKYFTKQPLSKDEINFLDKLGAYISLRKGKTITLDYKIISDAKESILEQERIALRQQTK